MKWSRGLSLACENTLVICFYRTSGKTFIDYYHDNKYVSLTNNILHAATMYLKNPDSQN